MSEFILWQPKGSEAQDIMARKVVAWCNSYPSETHLGSKGENTGARRYSKKVHLREHLSPAVIYLITLQHRP